MTNFITEMQKQKQNRYNTLAADYLSGTKEFTPIYVVEYLSMYDDDDIEYCLYKELNAEQRAEVERIIEECKKEEIPMWELLEEIDTPECIKGDGGHYGTPNKVDLETPNIRTKIKLAYFPEGLDNAPEVINASIVVSVEEYTALLAWQMQYRRANFGDLHKYEPELFSVVNEKIRDFWCDKIDSVLIGPVYTPMYVVDLVELKQDAEVILGEPEVRTGLYYKEDESSAVSVMCEIEERILGFHYSSYTHNDGTYHYDNRSASDVDAIAVQQALGVENYKGIIDKLKEAYGNPDGMELFRKFLDEHGIKYTAKDEKWDDKF